MNTELLKEGLTSVLKVTKEAPVLMEVKSGRLIIASHSDFHSIIFEMPTTMNDFKLVLSEKLARQLPKQIKTKFELEIDEDKNTAVVKSDGVKLELTTLDKGALSLAGLVKHYTKEAQWTINGQDFKAAFGKAMHSANDRSIGDIVLRGYHLHLKDGRAEVMASNGAAMTLVNFDLVKGDDEAMLLLNQDFFKATSLLYDEEVSLSYNSHAVTLQSTKDNVTLRIISSLTQGSEFDYQKVIDKVMHPWNQGDSKLCAFAAKDLQEIMKKMTFFLDDTTKYKMKVEIGPDKAVLSSDNVYGRAKNQLKLSESEFSEVQEVYISGLNLNSYLSSTKSDEIHLIIHDAYTPLLFVDDMGKEIITVFNV